MFFVIPRTAKDLSSWRMTRDPDFLGFGFWPRQNDRVGIYDIKIASKGVFKVPRVAPHRPSEALKWP